ncbi:DUF3140 domain-containing protein [Mycobacterium malmoense]|nr:DUF3140 domain-containing protein [Mycobacterium malmoense]
MTAGELEKWLATDESRVRCRSAAATNRPVMPAVAAL